MRLALRHILLSLALGVLANICISWVLALGTWKGVTATRVHATRSVPPSQAVVLQRYPSGSDARSFRQFEITGWGWRWMNGNSQDQPIAPGTPPQFVAVIALESGWPMLSMQGDYRSEDGSRGTLVNALGVFRSTPAGLDINMLPLRPIWPGFIVNSLLYASTLMALAILHRVIRVRLRTARDCCRACGYDLRGAKHSACPECGATLLHTV